MKFSNKPDVQVAEIVIDTAKEEINSAEQLVNDVQETTICQYLYLGATGWTVYYRISVLHLLK